MVMASEEKGEKDIIPSPPMPLSLPRLSTVYSALIELKTGEK